LQHLDYAAQLEWKRQYVIGQLERVGKLRVAGSGSGSGNVGPNAADEARAVDEQTLAGENLSDADGVVSGSPADDAVVVHPTLGMDDPWRYRNKVQVPIGEEEGGLVGGFYARGTHRIIDMDRCLIQHEQGDEVVAVVKDLAREL